jgi:hypothetical protein
MDLYYEFVQLDDTIMMVNIMFNLLIKLYDVDIILFHLIMEIFVYLIINLGYKISNGLFHMCYLLMYEIRDYRYLNLRYIWLFCRFISEDVLLIQVALK